MDYRKLKEDVVSVVNAYLGIRIIELLKPRCVDLFVQPLTATSLGIGGIFVHNSKSFTYTLSLNVTESSSILIMLTDGFGLLRKILWCKEFRYLSEFFLFMETRLEGQFSVICLDSVEKSA